MQRICARWGVICCSDVHELRLGVATASDSRRQRSFSRCEPLTPFCAWRYGSSHLTLHAATCKTSNLQVHDITYLTPSIPCFGLHRGFGCLPRCAAVSPFVSSKSCVSPGLSLTFNLSLTLSRTQWRCSLLEAIELSLPTAFALEVPYPRSRTERLNLSFCSTADPEPHFQSPCSQHTCTPHHVKSCQSPLKAALSRPPCYAIPLFYAIPPGWVPARAKGNDT
jgi:hypothetical protein